MSLTSREWIYVLIVLSGAGFLLSVTASIGYFTGAFREEVKKSFVTISKVSTSIMGIGSMVGIFMLWMRYQEVNHFPSQTMYEVINFLGVTTLIAGLLLRFLIPWKMFGKGAEGLGVLLQGLVFLLCAIFWGYALSLATTERDLPPALQSYWFPPHITALVFSYGTLFIAACLAYLYFSFASLRAIFEKRFSGKAFLGACAAVVLFVLLVPLWQMHAIFAVVYLLVVLPIALYLHLSGKGFSWISDWGRTVDELSFRIFAFGFPFLTAGVLMGALWAQEAWANYWGWDSKEVTALVSWFVYLIYLHLRFVVGWRGPKGMKLLLAGGAAIMITFQIFGYLPDSQKSLHRYTDPDVVPMEGMQGGVAADKD